MTYAYQKAHIENIIDSLEKYRFFIDNSETGLGKTYTCCTSAKKKNKKLFVVCPKSTIPSWRSVAKTIGVEIVDIMTYERLRGNGKTVTHDYLEYTQPRIMECTPKLKTLADTLFVFDEFHKCKNNSIQSKVVTKMTRFIRSEMACANLAFLTATVYSDVANSWNIFRSMGMTKHDVMYDSEKGMLGYRDVLRFAQSINSDVHTNLGVSRNDRVLLKDIHRMMTTVIFPEVMFSMVASKMDYEIENKCVIATKNVTKAINGLYSTAVAHINSTEQTSMGYLRRIMHVIEVLKAPYVASLARRALNENENNKVVIFVNYIDVMNYMNSELEEYNPVLLHGSVCTEERKRVIAQFNDPNTDHRVFISVMSAGGTGISLHDTDGRFPRTTLIMPEYNLINIKQSIGRTIRMGVKSKANVQIVYFSNGSEDEGVNEVKLIDSICKKSKVMKETSTDKDERIFPDEHPFVHSRVVCRVNVIQHLENVIAHPERYNDILRTL